VAGSPWVHNTSVPQAHRPSVPVVPECGLGRLTARDHPEVDRLPHRAVQAAGRRRSGPTSGRPQAIRARAPWCSSSVPARESPARVRPVGRPVGCRFSARDPASPGVACPTLVPRRARSANAQRADARHPSQCPEAHGPSVPRARLGASWWRWAARLPSRAGRPASQPAGPEPSASQRARGGRPTPQRRGSSPRAQRSNRSTTSARVAKRSGPGRPGALPACPPQGRLLGCGPRAPAAGSLPATRHRLGSPVPH
jgi:hypothetical protein